MVQRKPIGQIGAVSIGGFGVNWDKIRFPGDKVSQEAKVTSLFVAAINRTEGIDFHVEGLPEADHDARLISGQTEIDLQLMEVVIPSKKGSPYRSQERRYNAGFFADKIITKIKRKKYSTQKRPLWFLLYPTHWVFVPSSAVEYLLHRYFAENETPYSRAFLMHILEEDHGELQELHPVVKGQGSDAIQAYPNAAAARSLHFVNVNPQSVTPARRADRSEA